MNHFLDSGAVKDENEIIKWDGVKRRVDAWNQDHSLKTALQVSAYWFYVEASKRISRETMEKYYQASGYGNHNTEGYGGAYWIDGKLRVTPREQLDKLVKDSEVGEDDAHRAEGELDKLTSKYTGTVDEVVKVKEAELLEV